MKRFLCLMLVLSMIGLGPVLSGTAEEPETTEERTGGFGSTGA